MDDFYNYGVSMANQGNQDEAERYLAKALKLRPLDSKDCGKTTRMLVQALAQASSGVRTVIAADSEKVAKRYVSIVLKWSQKLGIDISPEGIVAIRSDQVFVDHCRP